MFKKLFNPFILNTIPTAIAMGETLDFTGKDISRISVDANSYCDYKIDSATGFKLDTVWAKWSSGAEINFNNQKNKNKPALDLRIMAYNYGDQEFCESLGGKYYDCNDSTKIKCPGKTNACLLSIDKYVPICSKVVQGEIPWSQRLKTSPYSIASYSASANSSGHDAIYFPYKYYLNTASIPFGAIITNGDALNASSTVFAGSAPREGDKYGLPYSCISNGRVSYISDGEITGYDNCSMMYFNGSKIVVAKNQSELVSAGIEGRRYTAATTGIIYQFKNILKTIWLKVTAVVGIDKYNFSNMGVGSDDTPILTTTTKNSATEFKAVLPKVENITLSPMFSSGLLNAKSKIAPNKDSGVYEIEKAGFYVLTFNTTVDAEQMPVKRLSVRIKQKSLADDWNSPSSVIDLYNIDPMPDSNNPHKIVRYLQVGDYYVLINLEDNWGFYQCLGQSSFVSNCCPGSPENHAFTTGCIF